MLSSVPRPFRLFREYDFFGVLLPGLASVVFLYMLIPRNVELTFPASVLFVVVFAFVFGQALHSVALFVESLPEIVSRVSSLSWSHRKKFEKELKDPDYVSRETVKRLRWEGARLCPGFPYREEFSEGAYTEREAFALYTFLRSYLHANEHSRSGNIKAMYAFCRNMLVLLFGLVPLYLLYGHLDSDTGVDLLLPDRGFINRPGKYLEFFPNYLRFLEAMIPLALIGGMLFLVGTFVYQRFYVQYLVSDFLTVRDADGGGPPIDSEYRDG